MVQAAIRALAKKEGSTNGFTEAAISGYIISAYPGIPQGHPMLLPYYLRKLVTNGEVFVYPSGRYFLPDSLLCEPIAPPPPVPRPNALPSRKSSLVLRLRKTISDGDVSWCYVGNGSTSTPSVTEQQSGSVATKSGGESYPPLPALMQADPDKALLLPSPSLVSDPNIEVDMNFMQDLSFRSP